MQPPEMQFQDTKLRHNFVLNLYNFVHQVPLAPPPKFELTIAQEGKVYKIWNFMYKIVQNENKIMIQFLILKLHFRGLHFTSPPNLKCA